MSMTYSKSDTTHWQFGLPVRACDFEIVRMKTYTWNHTEEDPLQQSMSQFIAGNRIRNFERSDFMIVSETKTAVSTVRIHDEFCVNPTSGRISHLNQIVSNSYKRRTMAAEIQMNSMSEQTNSLDVGNIV